MIDALTILQRAIDAHRIAPEYAKDALLNRLYRTTAPVLEEREALLAKLERGNVIQCERQPYEPGSLRPESDDPKFRKDSDRWNDWLSRLEEIENVLATFPASAPDSIPKHQTPPSGTPRTERSQTPLHQP
jgi:hypothetical protein